MKKSLLVMGILCFICCFSSAQASIMTYEIVEGIDNHGYELSGFLNISDTPIINTYEEGDNIGVMFDIFDFMFSSEAGYATGSSGSISDIGRLSSNKIYPSGGTFRVNLDYMNNYLGLENVSTWTNSGTGVFFIGSDGNYVDETLEGYSVLPEQIRIPSDFWGFNDNIWSPGGQAFVLQKTIAPVPEPSSILLLGVGLVGLVVFRKRLKN